MLERSSLPQKLEDNQSTLMPIMRLTSARLSATERERERQTQRLVPWGNFLSFARHQLEKSSASEADAT